MAAVVGSLGEARIRFAPRPDRVSLRLVERDIDEFGSRTVSRGAARSLSQRASSVQRAGTSRRAGGALATLVVFAGLWVGAGALRSTENAATVGRTDHAVVYVARPGDTLWAIATRLDPAGDPEQVAAALAAELHGAPLRPGVVLTVP